MKRYLIVTADDYGFSKERNKGVEDTFSRSGITSASLLLNCSGTQEAAAFFRSQNICPGLHLNLTEGKPLSSSPLPTLTNEEGKFWGRTETWQRLDNEKVDLEEIGREIQCQLDYFTTLVGRKPVYADGHQHIHIHPNVAEIFASKLQSHGVHATRLPLEVNMDKRTWLSPDLTEFYSPVITNSKTSRAVFDSHSITYSDAFFGLCTMGRNMTVERLQDGIMEAFQAAEEGCDQTKAFTSCELMSHPGYATPDNGQGGFDGWTDDFGCSRDREYEITILTSKHMLDFYHSNGIELISHKVLEPSPRCN